MADAISIQELIDARTDAKTLEEAVNGDAVTTVLSRLGETYPTLSNALNQIDSKLDSADAQVKQGITNLFENGGLPATPFATKALMTASALVDGKYAMVTDDTVNNGLYVKTAGAWVKSGYDPLMQSKSYTDSYRVVDKFKKPSSVYTPAFYGKSNPSSVVTGAPIQTTGVMFLNALTSNAIIQSLTVYTSLATQVKVAEVVVNAGGGYDVLQISESASVGVGVTTVMLQTPMTVNKNSYLVILSNVSKSLWFKSGEAADNGGYIGLTWNYDTTVVGSNVVAGGGGILPNYRLEAQIGLQYEVLSNTDTLNTSVMLNSNRLSSLSDLVTNKNNFGEKLTPVAGGLPTALNSAIISTPLSCTGLMDYAQFYAVNKGEIQLVVMQKNTTTEFEVVAVSEKILITSTGLQERYLTTPLKVNSGQYIGWYDKNKSIYWVNVSGNDVKYVGFSDMQPIVGNKPTNSDALSAAYRGQIKIRVSSAKVGIVTLTQTAYDALIIKDANTLYVVG